MPPKSSAKKDQILWYLCEKCQVHITSKDREEHEQFCPINADNHGRVPCAFVSAKTFYAIGLNPKPPTEDLSDLTQKQLNNFIFLSESLMQLCGFMLNEFVVLHSLDDTKIRTPVVRCVWPTANRYLTTVFVTGDELSSTWHDNLAARLKIEKLSYEPMPAAQVTLIPAANTLVDDKVWPDLCRIFAKHLCYNVYCIGSHITVEFFNKTFRFSVANIARRDYGNDLDDLEQRLQDLAVAENQFYQIARLTRYVLQPQSAAMHEDEVRRPKMQLIGGMDAIINDLRDVMNLAFGRTQSMAGVQLTRAVLVYGLPGCGKSLLCDALADESEAVIVKFNASDVFSKYFGETEANLLGYFEQAIANYPKPTVIIVEEIVNICAKENKEDSAKRVASAFLNALDKLHAERREAGRVFLLATTSNIETINPAARRCGRLDVEIEIPVPNPVAREDILCKHLARVKNTLSDDDIKWLANQTHGFVGADLSSLISKAAMHAINQKRSTAISTDISEPILRLNDIHHVFAQVKPSAMREVLIESPNVKWSDIGGQTDVILQLKQAIEWPLTHPQTFMRLGIKPPRGILMFGPPGCSKTMIAKALATESRVNFLSIKGPELFSMWVGESERAVRELFRKARQVAPAIIFFDEIDAIGGERSATGSSVKERVLAQLLTEMDGVNALNNVTIVAATNRPDLIDKALMRPGRIDRIVYVRLPDDATREDIFRIKMQRMPIDDDVDAKRLGRCSVGMSGAEIEAVCQEAALMALEDSLDAQIVSWKHFERALLVVKPRTNKDMLMGYDEYLKTY